MLELQFTLHEMINKIEGYVTNTNDLELRYTTSKHEIKKNVPFIK
jgi:hypothetical protein